MNAHGLSSLLRRQHLLPLTLFCLLSLVVVCGFVASRAQSPTEGEREVVEKIPKHLPIKVKIKKPEKLKDARDEDWLGELEVEVTNTGTKPIYYLYISVFLPDVFAPNGHNFGFPLEYGRTRLVVLSEPVRPDDVPLLPGEVVVLKVPAEQAELWRRGRAKGDRANPKKIEFIFDNLNFGDGTGFRGGKPLPEVKERSANDTCPGGDGNAVGAASAADPPRSYFPDMASLATYLPPPASLVPAFFFDRPASSAPAVRQDLCCTSPCSRLKDATDQGCECPVGERRIVQSASCSDPEGSCGSIIYESFQCMVNGQERFCERSRIDPTCAPPTPTPTPTPECTPPGPQPNICCKPKLMQPDPNLSGFAYGTVTPPTTLNARGRESTAASSSVGRWSAKRPMATITDLQPGQMAALHAVPPRPRRPSGRLVRAGIAPSRPRPTPAARSCPWRTALTTTV